MKNVICFRSERPPFYVLPSSVFGPTDIVKKEAIPFKPDPNVSKMDAIPFKPDPNVSKMDAIPFKPDPDVSEDKIQINAEEQVRELHAEPLTKGKESEPSIQCNSTFTCSVDFFFDNECEIPKETSNKCRPPCVYEGCDILVRPAWCPHYKCVTIAFPIVEIVAWLVGGFVICFITGGVVLIVMKRFRTTRRPLTRTVGYMTSLENENIVMSNLNLNRRNSDQDEANSNSTSSTDQQMSDVIIE